MHAEIAPDHATRGIHDSLTGAPFAPFCRFFLELIRTWKRGRLRRKEGGTIGTVPHATPYTYTELVRDFPVDNVQREIFDGELVVSPGPNTRHQRIVRDLALEIQRHINGRSVGEVFFAPLDTVLSETDVVQPDVMFVADDRREIITEKNVQGVPSLVVEVVSDTRRDRVRKRDIYARYGVPEYWIMDPEVDRVEVYKLLDGDYGKPEILEPGETLTYDKLPGLQIDLAKLFAR